MQSELGSSVIEFAIVAPFMIFLFMGLVDVGRGMYFGILAANAARAAASYGSQTLSTGTDQTSMTTAANNDGSGVTWTVSAQPLCSLNGASPTASACPGAGAAAPTVPIYYVQVTVTGQFSTLIQYPGIPKTIPISGTSVMRLAYQ